MHISNFMYSIFPQQNAIPKAQVPLLFDIFSENKTSKPSLQKAYKNGVQNFYLEPIKKNEIKNKTTSWTNRLKHKEPFAIQSTIKLKRKNGVADKV